MGAKFTHPCVWLAWVLPLKRSLWVEVKSSWDVVYPLDWFAYLYKTKTTNNGILFHVTTYKMSFLDIESWRYILKTRKHMQKWQTQAIRTLERSQVLNAWTKDPEYTWVAHKILQAFDIQFKVLYLDTVELWWVLSSVMWRCVAQYNFTNVSEERSAYTFGQRHAKHAPYLHGISLTLRMEAMCSSETLVNFC